MDSLSPLVAFVGGLLSLISPCVLPMIPVYIAVLCGPEIFRTGVRGQRLSVFFHSLSFVIGFSLIFIILGISAGLVGFAISSHTLVVRLVSGGLMILFGLFMLAAPLLPWLNYEKRLSANIGGTRGYLRSMVIGIIFALAWTPCVGPVLGGILALAINSQSVWQGGYLLAFYSLGVSLPFLIIGLVFDSLAPWMKRLSRYTTYVYLAGGIILIAVGILILTNKLSWFSY
jgi:cytochrome c-type biogenesis protein